MSWIRLLLKVSMYPFALVQHSLINSFFSDGNKTKLEYLGGGGAPFPSMLAPEVVRRVPGALV